MDYIESYEKALEGRKFHLETYHFWMNMYAIINGALFIGLYTATSEGVIRFSIAVLGCLAGWFWHLSVRGFHDWIISWILCVSRIEKKLGGRVYSTFHLSSKESKKEKIRPLSTPKLTKCFTLGVSVLWSLITIYLAIDPLKELFPCLFSILQHLKSCGYLIILVMLGIYIVICAIFYARESNLRESHDVVSKDDEHKA